MRVELTRVTTADGFRLDGALRRAPGRDGFPEIDVAVCVHGTGGNFYSSPLFDALSDGLVGAGIDVLRVNTRGHDAVSSAATSEGSRRQGAAYERVSDSRRDLAAWCEWLLGLGLGRIGLIGHSSGALKALYSLSERPIEGVATTIAISPPRLSHTWFRSSHAGATFAALFDVAERLVREGRPEQLLDIEFPLPTLVSAAAYLDKYGPAERYNLLHWVDKIAVPTHFFFGSDELVDNVAFTGLPEALTSLLGPRASVAVIPGANHFYVGKLPDLAARVLALLRPSPPQPTT